MYIQCLRHVRMWWMCIYGRRADDYHRNMSVWCRWQWCNRWAAWQFVLPDHSLSYEDPATCQNLKKSKIANISSGRKQWEEQNHNQPRLLFWKLQVLAAKKHNMEAFNVLASCCLRSSSETCAKVGRSTRRTFQLHLLASGCIPVAWVASGTKITKCATLKHTETGFI